MVKKVDVGHLKPGMYVAELDRPWLESPFLFQGFRLESDSDVKEVQDVCRFVYIDPERGDDVDVSVSHAASEGGEGEPDRELVRTEHKITVSFEEEIGAARKIHLRTRQQIDRMFEDARLGRSIDILEVKAVVGDMVDSIIRNPDAQLWLTNLRNRDEYTAIHSLNVCIFALTFGRHLGLSREELNELGVGALLHDIGKMRVPLEILNKDGRLTRDEFEIMKSHARQGFEILQAHAKQLPPSALDIAHAHHERMSGMGYPRGLIGDEITAFARIVAIVDVYDAITSDRIYHHGLSTLDALKNMFQWREQDFDKDLIEQFIQCIGIYPIGSLVELTTGEVGIVISVSQGRRLTPKVMLVRDDKKNAYYPPHIIDLAQFQQETDERLEIQKVLEPNAYGIDVRHYIREEIALSA